MIAMHPAPAPCEPDVICSIVRESAAHGWPHRATVAELVDVASRVFLRYGPGPYSTGHCDFDSPMMGPATCLVRPDLGQRRFRVRVIVFEDGSMRTWRIRPKSAYTYARLGRMMRERLADAFAR